MSALQRLKEYVVFWVLIIIYKVGLVIQCIFPIAMQTFSTTYLTSSHSICER